VEKTGKSGLGTRQEMPACPCRSAGIGVRILKKVI
jgi:hypothetical protein